MEDFNEILKKANYYYQKLNFNEAEKYYLQLINIQPDNDSIYYQLAILYTQTNSYDKSIKSLHHAINLNPNNPIYHITLGEIILKSTNYTSIEKVSQDILFNPDSSDLYYLLGTLYRKNKEYNKAIDSFEKSISLDRNNQKAYNSLGNLYLEHMQYINAKSVFNKLFQINPNFPQLNQKIDLIMNIQYNLKKNTEELSKNTTFEDLNKRYDSDDLIHQYITLLKKNLTDSLRMDSSSLDFKLLKDGLNWPIHAETMVGFKRLNNLHYCITETIKNNIEGDLIETGVWRGGSTILMNALLKAYKINNKKVWVADSFEGLPPPSVTYPEDDDSKLHLSDALKISIDDVKKNFLRYNLLDDNVIFLKGWFKDTLPNANIEKLSILRLDGDMYQSTIEALEALYHKLSIGGYIIIDDYYAVPACKKAVDFFRVQNNINEKLELIDCTGIYWRKEN